jgi:hypothetical protein
MELPQTTKAEAINLALIIGGLLSFSIIVAVIVTLGNLVK